MSHLISNLFYSNCDDVTAKIIKPRSEPRPPLLLIHVGHHLEDGPALHLNINANDLHTEVDRLYIFNFFKLYIHFFFFTFYFHANQPKYNLHIGPISECELLAVPWRPACTAAKRLC